MAGISNTSYRKIVKQMGVGLIYAEMVSSNALMYGNNKTLELLKMSEEERPIAQQIFGSDITTFVEAAKIVENTMHPDIIDINMGCPVPKVALRAQAGSALLKDPEKIKEIVGINVTVAPVIKANAYGLGVEALKDIFEEENIKVVFTATIEEAIIKTKYKNLYVLPASINLAGIDIEILDQSRNNSNFVKAEQLKLHIDKIKDKFDFIIIDCPPALGIITTNALTASDSVIIPVQCEFFALEGITQLLRAIMYTQQNLNPKLSIEGVLLTMLDARTNLGVEVSQEVRKYFREKVYDVVIPRNIKLSEAPSEGLNIFDYDAHSEGAKAYAKLAKEVVKRNGRK